MSAETGAEQMGKRPGTTAVARTDGDDVNLVTTSASGELPNHPEASGGREYGETKPTILNPVKNRVSVSQPYPRPPRPNLFNIPVANHPGRSARIERALLRIWVPLVACPNPVRHGRCYWGVGWGCC